jgi:hypothetical protein
LRGNWLKALKQLSTFDFLDGFPQLLIICRLENIIRKKAGNKKREGKLTELSAKKIIWKKFLMKNKRRKYLYMLQVNRGWCGSE